MTMAATPALGLASEDVRGVLALASPDAHCRFVVRPEQIELHTTFPHSREGRLACGAALLNVRLALQGHGVRPLVTLLPGPSAGNAAAVVRLGGHQDPSPDVLALLHALRTHRRSWSATTRGLGGHRGVLARAAEVERAWLHPMGNTTSDIVVCSFSDGAAAELRAGQATQRVVLTAATVGVSLVPVSHTTCLSALRADLRPCLGSTLVPQTVLRVSAA
ncbi:hypothetical protein Lesp02_38750 [Lentzea sp. NBRC 105346]|uniref:hypothetical protein n=1 Tax=Lentzea sp. NBRC 105346 TaxID=3032205 RepID=UPI0024A09750|nr:hypothetical protein [Lentzea sp. NBRC 105346]GLZ31687.1 hypothetical protein Lesp02_38750 [Lentzea sp. NBRC 105346]